MTNEEQELLLQKIHKSKRIKQRLAYESPFWFALLYLRHHFTSPLAPFHIEMFYLMQQKTYDLVVIMAFRESGKSTICNLANVLWSALGSPEKKLILIISETQEQAKSHFANIKAELQNNESLREDFGPFTEDGNMPNKLSLELTYHGSKIISLTRDQSIRGFKHGQYRPDLIICDDLEDMNGIKESEVLYKRFQNEIVPVGSMGTKIVVLGNLLSERSFMMHLKTDIDSNGGIFRAYPFLDDCRKVLWKEKFPDIESINKLIGKLSIETWNRDYLLNISERWPRDGNDWSIQKPQDPLIKQMQEFKISAPFVGLFIPPELGDPRYEKYQGYLKEIQNRIDAWRKEAREKIIRRIKEMPE